RDEALADEVVAAGSHDVLADLGTAAAVDAAAVVAQDEGVRLIPAVAVVDADVRVVLDRALVDGHVERRLVLDRRLAQVTVADRLAGALQAAPRLGHRLVAGVAELVLAEAGLALIGAKLAHHRLGLLHVVREGHDGQEVGLRLAHDAAHLRVVEVVASQPVVDRVRGAPALADRLHYGRGPRPDVARGEHLGQAGAEDVVLADQGAAAARLELRADLLGLALDPGELGSLADGAQHGVAAHDEFGARHRLRTAATLLVRLAEVHALELDPGHLVLLVGDDSDRGSLEDDPRPLLDRLVHLVLRRHVLEVAAVDEGHLARLLAQAGARAVDGGESATDDDDLRVLERRNLDAARAVVEVLQGVDHAVGVLAGDHHLVRLVTADPDVDRVVALHQQVGDVEVAAEPHVRPEGGAQLPDVVQLAVHPLLRQPVGRDPVTQHAALLRIGLV